MNEESQEEGGELLKVLPLMIVIGAGWLGFSAAMLYGLVKLLKWIWMN